MHLPCLRPARSPAPLASFLDPRAPIGMVAWTGVCLLVLVAPFEALHPIVRLPGQSLTIVELALLAVLAAWLAAAAAVPAASATSDTTHAAVGDGAAHERHRGGRGAGRSDKCLSHGRPIRAGVRRVSGHGQRDKHARPTEASNRVGGGCRRGHQRAGDSGVSGERVCASDIADLQAWHRGRRIAGPCRGAVSVPDDRLDVSRDCLCVHARSPAGGGRRKTVVGGGSGDRRARSDRGGRRAHVYSSRSSDARRLVCYSLGPFATGAVVSIPPHGRSRLSDSWSPSKLSRHGRPTCCDCG